MDDGSCDYHLKIQQLKMFLRDEVFDTNVFRHETLKSMSENKMNEFRKMMIVLLVNDDEFKIEINAIEVTMN